MPFCGGQIWGGRCLFVEVRFGLVDAFFVEVRFGLVDAFSVEIRFGLVDALFFVEVRF